MKYEVNNTSTMDAVYAQNYRPRVHWVDVDLSIQKITN